MPDFDPTPARRKRANDPGHDGLAVALDTARRLHCQKPLHRLLASWTTPASTPNAASTSHPPTMLFASAMPNEAVARAELLLGNKEHATENLSQARKCADQVTDSENQKRLVNDLEALTQ